METINLEKQMSNYLLDELNIEQTDKENIYWVINPCDDNEYNKILVKGRLNDEFFEDAIGFKKYFNSDDIVVLKDTYNLWWHFGKVIVEEGEIIIDWIKNLGYEVADKNLIQLISKGRKLNTANGHKKLIDRNMNDTFFSDGKFNYVLRINQTDNIKAASLYALLQYVFDAPNVNVDDYEIKINVQSPGSVVFSTISSVAMSSLLVVFTTFKKLRNKTIDKMLDVSDKTAKTAIKYKEVKRELKKSVEQARYYAKDVKSEKKVKKIRALNAEAITINDFEDKSKEVKKAVIKNLDLISKQVTGILNTKEMMELQVKLEKNILARHYDEVAHSDPKFIKKHLLGNLTADIRAEVENFSANELREIINKKVDKEVVPKILKDLDDGLTIDEKEVVIKTIKNKIEERIIPHFEHELTKFGEERLIKQNLRRTKLMLKNRRRNIDFEHMRVEHEHTPTLDEIIPKRVTRIRRNYDKSTSK